MTDSVESAVLIPVYRGADAQLRVVLIRRMPGGIHGGQIAFPGGKKDPADATLLDTAMRETHEEIGLTRERVTILDELPSFDTVATGFIITPFLARIERPNAWILDPREVAEVIEPTLDELTDPSAQDSEMRKFDRFPHPIRIDFTHLRGHQLWGATYRILQPLLPRLAADEWSI